MPFEFLPLFAAAIVFAAIVYFAWRYTTNPEHQPTAKAEAIRLEHQIAWLENRLALAHREAWSDDMKQDIVDRLNATRVELEAVARLSIADRD